MKTVTSIGLALALLTTAFSAPIIREPGVIYLSDFALKAPRLKVMQPTGCFFDVAQTRYAGTLRFPQAVELVAISAEGTFRIRGNAQQGGVVAWAPPEAFEPLPEKFVENLRKSEERRIAVEALISQNEVAIGMTIDEVGRSLGKPQKKTNRADKNGTQQVWEYIKYALVPQTTVGPGFTQTTINIAPTTNFPGGTITQGGVGLTSSTIYVKVPVGKLAVTFADNVVESLDQSEGTTVGGRVSVVVPPITVY